MPKSVLDIAVVAAVLSLVVSVNGDLLTACKANESGIRPPLDLVHMRVPPPVSAFIAAVELFFAARNLHDITATMLTLQDARPGFYYWFRGDNSHRMTPQMGLDCPHDRSAGNHRQILLLPESRHHSRTDTSRASMPAVREADRIREIQTPPLLL